MREYVVTVGGVQHKVERREDGKFVMPPALSWIRGYSVALKPAFEPIVLARKPLSAGLTVAANVLRWRTGALNIDGCRIGTEGATKRSGQAAYALTNDGKEDRSQHWARTGHDTVKVDAGRWPANLLTDGSEEVVGAFPRAKGAVSNGRKGQQGLYEDGIGPAVQKPGYGDDGSAARFFKSCPPDEMERRFHYSAKASKADRAGSKHPTVKPISLIEWLATLITPPGGVILDPFAGSGTTAVAARNKGFKVVLCEREDEYVQDIRARFGVPRVDGQEATLVPTVESASVSAETS